MPLEPAAYVCIHDGNHVMKSMVGKRGTLLEYFDDSDKWGIKMDDGEMVLIRSGNLQRLS